MSRDYKSFWVIFDTCTKPDYYADIHKLLALPPGWVLRYDYRRGLLSDRAADAIFGGSYQPDEVLLAYAQSRGYVRGDEPPADSVPEDMLFVPTRLGRVELIPLPDGERAYFDIKVSGYPDPHHEAATLILDELVQAREVPYSSWVAISERATDLADLKRASGDGNWEHIVDVLGRPPNQFVDDIFWRMGLPTEPRESRQPTTQDLVGDNGTIYQRVSRIELFEGHEMVSPITSHTPSGTAGGSEPRRLVNVSSNSQRLQVVGNGQVELRRYSQGTIRVRASQTDLAGTTTEAISLTSSPHRDNWPPGAAFEIEFRVRKSRYRLIVGSGLLLVAAALGAAATAASGGPKLILSVLAAMAGLGGLVVLLGKLGKP
jgi:hypothetical protein